jgi:hypothetical protein
MFYLIFGFSETEPHDAEGLGICLAGVPEDACVANDFEVYGGILNGLGFLSWILVGAGVFVNHVNSVWVEQDFFSVFFLGGTSVGQARRWGPTLNKPSGFLECQTSGYSDFLNFLFLFPSRTCRIDGHYRN